MVANSVEKIHYVNCLAEYSRLHNSIYRWFAMMCLGTNDPMMNRYKVQRSIYIPRINVIMIHS